MRYNPKFFRSIFSRRLMILGGAKAFLLSILGVRIWWLQVKERKKYYDLAEGNRIDIRFLLPSRGRILTEDFIPIANVIPKFEIVLIPYRVKELEPTLAKLSKITEIAQEKIDELKKLNRHLYRYAFVPIKTITNWDEAITISQQLYALSGIDMHVISERIYTDAQTFCHITGYVGSVNKQDQKNDPASILRIPGMKIGKQGIEKANDVQLRGKAGALRVEVNHLGRVRKELSRKDPISGTDLHLTVNSILQKTALESLKEESGATVLMNVRNGAVLAMASSPTYDPNLFINGISHENWNILRNNDRAPMNNKAIIGQYPPGSTFKMMTLLAGLESGMITPEEKIYCGGHYALGTSKFHCWKYSGHGPVNAAESLKLSCDVYFYELSQRIGIKRIAEVAKRYGLDAPTGIELPYEKSGLIPTPEWKEKRFGKSWLKGDSIISSIGQGSVLTTPLQLAVMTARLATDKMVIPNLIQKSEIPSFEDMEGVNKNYTDIIRQGMFDVVNMTGGTAPSGKIQPEFGKAAGKTGTAQVRRISARERKRGVLKNKELAWKYRDHALYVGFAPFDNPIFAVATIVEHGGSGSKVAAPIATKTLKKAFEIYGLEGDVPYV